MADGARERGRQTRTRLLRAATELIPSLGWNAVTTRKIAERAGLPPGLVHYHFRSVAELLAEAALGTAREAVAESLRLLDEAPDLPSGLRAMLHVAYTYGGQDPASVLMTEAYLAATRDQALADRLGAVLEEFRTGLTDRLADGAVAEPAAVSAALSALLDGLIMHRSLLTVPPVDDLAPVLLRITGLSPTEREKQ
ncbi:MAG: TetR family transcriptional regulator [Pseudonocardiaceae bacterium]|nr:TetR family transcriptional regulator [Pseudonocardiaceae bacterium]